MSDEGAKRLTVRMTYWAPFDEYAMEPIVLIRCPVHGGGVVRAVDVHIDCCDEMTIEQRGYRAKR